MPLVLHPLDAIVFWGVAVGDRGGLDASARRGEAGGRKARPYGAGAGRGVVVTGIAFGA